MTFRTLMIIAILASGAIYLGVQIAPESSSRPAADSEMTARRAAIVAALAYLDDLDEVTAVKVPDRGLRNNVLIGFASQPADLPMVVAGAALKANKAIGFGVHVWAVPPGQTSLPPERYLCEATARSGRITDNSC